MAVRLGLIRTGLVHVHKLADTYLGRTAKKAVLNLFVQSAYVRDWAHSNRPHTKPIGFNIILYNVLHGKEIKVPK